MIAMNFWACCMYIIFVKLMDCSTFRVLLDYWLLSLARSLDFRHQHGSLLGKGKCFLIHLCQILR
jgi:hypothetical protein